MNESTSFREMELGEFCAKLPEDHTVNRELRILKHCREYPFKWAMR